MRLLSVSKLYILHELTIWIIDVKKADSFLPFLLDNQVKKIVPMTEAGQNIAATHDASASEIGPDKSGVLSDNRTTNEGDVQPICPPFTMRSSKTRHKHIENN